MTKRQPPMGPKSRIVASCAIGRMLAAALTVAILNRSAEAKVAKVTVFRSGQEGCFTYRIPVIVRAHNGDLLAFAEGRKKSASDFGDIDIVLKRSSDKGRTWGPLELV